jgi:hypothetical protein
MDDCWLLVCNSDVKEDKKEDDFSTGPLSVLTQSVKNNTQVLQILSWLSVVISSHRYVVYLLPLPLLPLRYAVVV